MVGNPNPTFYTFGQQNLIAFSLRSHPIKVVPKGVCPGDNNGHSKSQ